MKINFYPDHDDPKFEKAAKEYTRLWDREGEKIIKVIEKISGLKFKDKVINALIYEGNSYSRPLILQSEITIENKKADLIHELCHRLVSGQGYDLKFKNKITSKNYNLEFHKVINLILYDIWVILYGKDFAKKQIKYEISFGMHGEANSYKLSWDWISKMTKEQRAKEFKKYFRK